MSSEAPDMDARSCERLKQPKTVTSTALPCVIKIKTICVRKCEGWSQLPRELQVAQQLIQLIRGPSILYSNASNLARFVYLIVPAI